ncbi:Glycosyltransferase, catalytic subunit of cellulose synthase and poly-beta-1,6-N-acetylglucosamine synthase [Polaribacter sp. KT25b]|uniref:glycosyltransferase n=1 Tax=Polaribacter sp. KT25b TaxID=1855336 RepID=UPI00087D25A2|nr:glycosyltransferase [Polaribacter sp. KT25b]SDR80614.1 Glycosyltransferase, catalytic subunit of cellulose synthase and poly-beta-1,6-N-acetylglucosamine synthase [Polaribacter sp. KT25b]
MILSVIFYAFVVCAVIQLTYLFTFSSFLFKPKRSRKTKIEIPVSVIILVKNQSEKLLKLIPLILEQSYETFEIVIINNASSDDTNDIIELFSKKHTNIKVVQVENNEAFWASKKYALTLGIKASKYDHLLFTNANCNPVSKDWISEMSKKFTSKKEIILGYRKYKKEKSIFNIFVRFDNLLTAIKCFGFAKMNSPFMAFEGNYAYDKPTFFKVNGFINHMKINFAEADLFIKDASQKENTTFCISESSFTEKDTPKSFSKWFSDKKDTAFIRKKYMFKHRFLLNTFAFTKILFYILATILFFTYPYQITLSIVLFYCLVYYIIIGISAKKLKEPQIIFFLPFLEIGLLLIQITIFISNLNSKPSHWK